MLGPETEAAKAAELRRWKNWMLALLVLAAVIFLSCSWWQSQAGGAPAWVGFVRAAAEAGMIGGLADWFAVTALFRHPMGLKIPHTALIPNNKDKVGDTLGTFVEEKFLTKEALSELVRKEQIPLKAARYLVHNGGAERLSQEGGRLIVAAVRNISTAEATEFINTQVIARLRDPEWAPPAGRILETYIADGKARPLEDDLIHWAHAKVGTLEEEVIVLVDEKMPAWLPKFARGMAGDKVYDAIVSWADDVLVDPNHNVRLALRRGLAKFAQDLQYDPAMVARVEGIKEEFFDSAQMQQAPGALWATVSETIIEQAKTPESYLRTKLAEVARSTGKRIISDTDFRKKLDGYVDTATEFAVDNYSSQVIELIPATIKQWPVEEASRVIELQVGKDLQFIRLNGTVVGALAGLALYTVNEVLF
ncbi:DUF445 domain-containing protein [Corynebacterium phocae]|nr:DUF445 family protein [Corynebacterium phocae]KAA8728455.1 DUF445 family protein [Corynebacterium phocae]